VLVDASVYELHKEIGMTLSSNDLTMLSNNPVRVSLYEGKHIGSFTSSRHMFQYFSSQLMYALMLSLCKLLRHSCDEYILATIHYMILYMDLLLIPIRVVPSEGRTTWVRRYCKSRRVLVRTVPPVPPGTHMSEQ
jgi:hypothetical protein